MDNSLHGLAEQMVSCFEDFKQNHEKSLEKENKSAARRARKALSELKKLIPVYRKQSMEFVESL